MSLVLRDSYTMTPIRVRVRGRRTPPYVHTHSARTAPVFATSWRLMNRAAAGKRFKEKKKYVCKDSPDTWDEHLKWARHVSHYSKWQGSWKWRKTAANHCNNGVLRKVAAVDVAALLLRVGQLAELGGSGSLPLPSSVHFLPAGVKCSDPGCTCLDLRWWTAGRRRTKPVQLPSSLQFPGILLSFWGCSDRAGRSRVPDTSSAAGWESTTRR